MVLLQGYLTNHWYFWNCGLTYFGYKTLPKKIPPQPCHSEAKLRKLKNKYKYCSTYLLFPAIFERTVEPEKFCLSVRKTSFCLLIHPSMINNTTTKSKYCSAPFRAPQYLNVLLNPKNFAYQYVKHRSTPRYTPR